MGFACADKGASLKEDSHMVITIKSGRSFDTEKDLSAAERHILQKLIIWEHMASSVDQFRQKRKDAMNRGWNNSGPVEESDAMRAIASDWEENVRIRVGGASEP
jgi:hypothetical protein